MFLSKKSLEAKLREAERRKRELEKAQSLGWIEGDPYTAKEIVALHEIHCSLVEEHVFRYSPGGALWQFSQGHVAELSFAPVLRMVDNAFREIPGQTRDGFHNLLERIGAHMAIAIRDNNAELFHQLHVVLSYRRAGKRLSEIPLKQLSPKNKRGRKASCVDLSRLFPLALMDITATRLSGYGRSRSVVIKEKITRAEITEHIKGYGGTISDTGLSRWITKFKFGAFMAEQPIALKPRKSANK